MQDETVNRQQTAEKSKEFRLSLFGKLELRCGDTVLTENDIHSAMVSKLLAFLLVHHDEQNSLQSISKEFWSNDESSNPAGALKNLAYRVRKTLSEKWPDDKLILTGRGYYRWNPDYTITLDTEEMSSLIAKAKSTDNDREAADFEREAIALYKGKFLEDYNDEFWIISLMDYYQNRYLNTVKKLNVYLLENREYEEIEDICSKAIEEDPLDEQIHMDLIRAYLGEGRQQKAETHYSETVALLYDHLGVQPSESLRELYASAMKQQHQVEYDITRIRDKLEETGDKEGAFICEYGTFKKIYQLESRRIDRMGLAIYLSLITIESLSEDEEAEIKAQSADQDEAQKQLVREMHRMEGILLGSLRTGDVITRYSNNQYLSLLDGCNYENARRVMTRVTRKYYAGQRKLRFKVQYSLIEMNLKA
ncbi:MAG: BTAD domain-containing putative transcriptional regulator [Eubacterium sp.]|nr:BTAD domain-containing putative transcriptional regulator [Eubacterium sp.]